jgi:Fe-S cluster biogenesis protein NfuA
MPKIADIEPTPNPNARKFVLKEPLSWGVTRSYDSAAEAEGDTLAQALFAIPHVTSVFYIDRWLTVTQDGQADWEDLLRALAPPIREAPAAQEQTEQLLGRGPIDESALSEPDRDKLRLVMDLLDERIRPFLQQDGGDLHVVGFDGSTLEVHYQGACGSCPSSLSGTLGAIESLVHEIDPQLSVVPV